MNRLLLVLGLGSTALATALPVSVSSAAPLTDEERLFVLSSTGATLIAGVCPGVKIVFESLDKLIDRYGIDGAKYSSAIVAVMEMNQNKEYDRAVLIPEITRQVNAIYKELGSAIRANKAKACKEYTDILESQGLVTTK